MDRFDELNLMICDFIDDGIGNSDNIIRKIHEAFENDEITLNEHQDLLDAIIRWE